jgi:hypothetical protein
MRDSGYGAISLKEELHIQLMWQTNREKTMLLPYFLLSVLHLHLYINIAK